jgi:DNA helicase-2/ATP-dependent DNA helicase PcrA
MTPTLEQRAVIDSDAERILCAACPGSGKTFTLISRILRLVAQGAHPENMAAITYTNAAAGELNARLRPEDGSIRLTLGFTGTLHSFCLRHLHENGHKGATVLGQEEADAELLRVARDCNVDCSAKHLKELKAAWWNGVLTFTTRLVIGNYYRRLEAERLLDYDSILRMALASMRDDTPPNTRFWEHLFVDEFQDASQIDAEIYEVIDAKNRFYVGDKNQAIFGFKGSNAECFDKLIRDDAWQKLPLTGSFRSAPQICEAASALVSRVRPAAGQARNGGLKAITSLTHTQGTVDAHRFESDEAEAAGIARAIKTHVQATARYGDYAVLARTRQIAQLIAEALEDTGIPVRAKRKSEEPQEWLIARAAVRLLHLKTDDAAARWLRAIRVDADREIASADKEGDSLFGRVWCGCGVQGYPHTVWTDLAALRVDDHIVERIGELWASLTEKTLPNLALAMAQVNAEEETTGEGVFVGTVHSAKGREFNFVVLAGCEEGVWPSEREDLEESRRVFYVGMTRARTSLWMTCAAKRARWRPNGGGRTTLSEMEPSRFITEAGL